MSRPGMRTIDAGVFEGPPRGSYEVELDELFVEALIAETARAGKRRAKRGPVHVRFTPTTTEGEPAKPGERKP